MADAPWGRSVWPEIPHEIAAVGVAERPAWARQLEEAVAARLDAMQAQIDQLGRAAAKDEAKGDARCVQGAAGGDAGADVGLGVVDPADMDDCACEAELEESMWISPLLIGTRPVGDAASAYLLLLLLLTM
eukprot:2837761-Prymnesium_polylepis.1